MAGGSLRTGEVIGRYRVEAFIGAGGMGEVYRAHDQTLDRLVALKVLPVAQLNDDRIRRFMSEAHNASRLRHPSIVTVHDSGTYSNGSNVHFLAMELVEGWTLAAPGGRRDLPKTLEIMARVAEGLATAHANGIVHRDLKPENIMVSRDGHPKILDFGISKLIEPPVPKEEARTTDPATILGTAAYMSPEQVTGASVDHRTDIFSFGAVLYELVTGESPFEGTSAVDTLHNILHRQAPFPEVMHRDLKRILRKCLAKDREERYQSIKDVAIDLRELVAELRENAAQESARRVRWIAPVAVLALLAVAGGWFLLRTQNRSSASPPTSARMTRLTFSGNVMGASISPDGNYLAYSVRDKDLESLWVKQLATGSLVRLLEGRQAYLERIRFSPDGNYVYFVTAPRGNPNIFDINQIPILGGEPRRVVGNIDGGYTISPDSRSIAYCRFDAVERRPKLFITNLESGAERLLLERPEGSIGALTWAPDGETITMASILHRSDKRRRIEEVRISDGSTRELISQTLGFVNSLEWMPDGSGLLFTAGTHDQPSQVWFVSYPGGETRKLTSDIVAYLQPTVTRDGKSMVAGRFDGSSNLWVIEAGKRSQPRPLTTGLANLYGLGGDINWTEQGKIYFTSWEGGSEHLKEITAPALKESSTALPDIRHMFKAKELSDIDISPDGQNVAYVSDISGTEEVWTSSLDGSNARQVTRRGRTGFPSFFPDGKSIAFISINAENQFAYKVSLKNRSIQPLTARPANNTHVSPDGKWLLCRYREPEPGKPLWRTALVSLGQDDTRIFELPRYGGSPILRWLPDGTAFSFVDWKDGVANIWVQSIDGGEPRQVTFLDSGSIYGFDWSPDGARLVLSQGNPISDAVMLTNFR